MHLQTLKCMHVVKVGHLMNYFTAIFQCLSAARQRGRKNTEEQNYKMSWQDWVWGFCVVEEEKRAIWEGVDWERLSAVWGLPRVHAPTKPGAFGCCFIQAWDRNIFQGLKLFCGVVKAFSIRPRFAAKIYDRQCVQLRVNDFLFSDEKTTSENTVSDFDLETFNSVKLIQTSNSLLEQDIVQGFISTRRTGA